MTSLVMKSRYMYRTLRNFYGHKAKSNLISFETVYSRIEKELRKIDWAGCCIGVATRDIHNSILWGYQIFWLSDILRLHKVIFGLPAKDWTLVMRPK
jgi:hypothetical protein